MAIFQESIVQKHLKGIEEAELDLAYKKYKEVYGVQKIENIKKAKEEQYQEGFIKDIFGHVLGYSIFPEQPYNIQTETKNVTDSKKAEWEDYFTSESQKAHELKSQIDQTDKEIDRMVYELYGLTEKEIKIVENS